MDIRNAVEWDRLLDAIEDSAAAGAARAMLDPGMSALERKLGLSRVSREAIFGERTLPRRSLILSWFELMREKAREERESGKYPDDDYESFHGAGAAPDVPDEKPTARLGGYTAERVARIAKQAAPAKKSEIISSYLTDYLSGKLQALVETPPSSLSADAWKVFPEDRMSPRERIERHIRFDAPDRVAVAPLLGFHTARAGGYSVREFMTDGRAAARAARTTWQTYGGFDMTPFHFALGYLFPFMPESHSRFCSRWQLPDGDELPKMLEEELYPDYETIHRDGCFAIARAEGGRLMREFREMIPEGIAYAADMARYFPRADLFYPYAMGVINHPADLLSMWIGFERFMMDCATDPLKIREACERLGPGLVELGELPGRFLGAKQVLYGGSRMAASWISRKMFDNIFAETFLAQSRQANRDGFKLVWHLDNDYTPFLDFFLELPRHGGFLHLDQTDMFKAKEMLHGHLCLMGNLHPGLLAAGTPEEVTAQCERLIKEVGAGGGFILSSACEVPINTPAANLHAVKSAVERWGFYNP